MNHPCSVPCRSPVIPAAADFHYPRLGSVLPTLLIASGLLFTAANVAADDPPALREGFEHYQQGRYAEAVESWAVVLKKNPESNAAIIGMSRALEAEGQFDEALATVSKRLEEEPDNASLLARRAELFFARGDLKKAAEDCVDALNADEDHARARLVQARIFVERGDLKQADQAFRWFVRFYNRRQPRDARTLLLVADGASEYARWHSVSSIFNFVVNTLCVDAARDNPLSWEAHYVSGSLLLEKYNRSQAIPDLKKALTINARAVPVLTALGRAALQKHDLDNASLFAGQALEVRSNDPAALRLKADVLIHRGQLKEALKLLTQARAVNPIDQETLGRLAAAHYISGKRTPDADERLKELLASLDAIDDAAPEDPDAIEAIVIDVARRNPRPGRFLSSFARILETRRKFDLAEKLYQHAIRVMPQLSEPKTQLGMLYMQTGRTDQARVILDEAFSADPYHVRVNNMRKVLNVLDKYETITTDHFVIRVDSKADRILGEYMAEYLEEVYAEIVDKYDFEPPQRTTFEIYHNAKGLSAHQWFSARMVGLPWIQTIGASTGMMVALASPTASGQQFNWARVIKHEFVHIVTLQQTRFNIPHWFTEALAVTSEGIDRPAIWNQLLLQRVPTGQLSRLDELNQVFIRPRTPNDWQFAYCQSRLYAQYMIEKFGEDRIPKMLEAYRSGISTDQAIPDVFGVSVDEFEKGYRTFLKNIVENELGVASVHAPKSLSDLEKEHEAEPDNADRVASFAAGLLRNRRRRQARELAEKAIQLDGKNPIACVVLAQIELQARDLDDAATWLETAFDEEHPNQQVLGLLARVRLMQGRFENAAELYELGQEKLGIGQRSLPGTVDWLKGQAAAYVKLDQNDKLKTVLEQISRIEGNNLSSRRKLAEMAVERGDFEEARRWGERALQIDVMDRRVHEILARAYRETGEEKRASREERILQELPAE